MDGKITPAETEKEHPTQKNYQNFFFKFFLKEDHSLSPLKVTLFFVLGFIVPRCLFYELALGVSSMNFLFFSQELIDSAPTYWAGVSPHIDWFNIFSILTCLVLIIFAKKVYAKCYHVKDFIYQKLDPEHYGDDLDSKRIEFDEEMSTKISTIFSRQVKTVVILILIGLPLATIFIIDFPLLQADFSGVIMTEIIQIHGYLFVYFMYGACIIMVLGVIDYIEDLRKYNVEVNILDPDQVGGLKEFADLTVLNVYFFIVGAVGFIPVVFNYYLDIITTPYFFYVISISALVIVFLIFICFYYPFRVMKEKITLEKDEARTGIFIKIDRDYEKFKKETELESGFLIHRMQMVANLEYYTKSDIRTWPWNMPMVQALLISLLLPILDFVISFYVFQ